MTKNQRYWNIRAANYDKLFWVKDRNYLDAVVEASDLHKSHLVLDVGSGSGAVANKIKKHVKHVVAVDISHSMLQNGNWEGISVIKWDIGDSIFVGNLFDRIIARMVFHHVLDNLDRVLLRCYDILKKGGKIVVAEGIPPSDESHVVNWYTEMFKFKEERRTFSIKILRDYLHKNGFRDITNKIHITEDFNINNWLVHSDLSEKNQKNIYNMHVNADDRIKDIYNMRIKYGECFVRTVNVIMVAQK